MTASPGVLISKLWPKCPVGARFLLALDQPKPMTDENFPLLEIPVAAQRLLEGRSDGDAFRCPRSRSS